MDVYDDIIIGLRRELQDRLDRDRVDVCCHISADGEMVFISNEVLNVLLGITIINGNKLSISNLQAREGILIDLTNPNEFDIDDIYKKVRVMCQR